MFRKTKTSDGAVAVETPEEDVQAKTRAAVSQEAKGRPTPTRREAELARRKRLTTPSDPKAVRREQRQRDFELTTARQHGGPVKSFARDYVDQRYRAAEFFIPLAVAMFVLASIRSTTTQLLSIALWIVMLVLIVIDSVILVLGVRRAAAKRFPGQSLGRIGIYSLMRSLQFRRWRLPKPRLKRGQPI